jgi:iron complex transport system substrate-binding protein
MMFCGCLVLLTACGNQSTAVEPGNKEGTRLVKHAMGETTVPTNPQRVIALDYGELDNALALGITPIGATTNSATGDGDLLSYVKDKTAKTVGVGTSAQPNLEKILSLNPDLILGDLDRHGKIYHQLSEIAPTVLSEDVNTNWEVTFNLTANALNKIPEGEALLQHYQNSLKDFKQQIVQKGATPQVSLLRVYTNKVRVYMKNSFSGLLLEDAGLKRPPFSDKNEFFVEVGLEQLKDIGGDALLIAQFGGNEEDAFTELKKQPLWQNMAAVKNKRVFVVNDDVWIKSLGIGGAQLAINDLSRYLLS